jgi:hypothetical protein
MMLYLDLPTIWDQDIQYGRMIRVGVSTSKYTVDVWSRKYSEFYKPDYTYTKTLSGISDVSQLKLSVK